MSHDHWALLWVLVAFTVGVALMWFLAFQGVDLEIPPPTLGGTMV